MPDLKVGVYFCQCGGIVSEKIDAAEVERRLAASGELDGFKVIELACDDSGQAQIADDLREKGYDGMVIAACSPRDHEATFRGVMARAGLNPFMFQMVNVREHIAWVTQDPAAATSKAAHQILGAIGRVRHHRPLERKELELRTETLVIGGGPAGLKAAMTLAEAGRKVILVEREPILGGMPVRYDEVFPRLECGPCVIEPFIAESLHGPHAEHIEIHLLSEVTRVVGSFGNFTVTIREKPRYVNLESCVGCGACIEACPASSPSRVNVGMSQRKAMDFAFFGGLPNVPYLDATSCVRGRGESCDACQAACPVPDTVHLDDQERLVEREVGAILLAVGSVVYDCSNLPALGHGTIPGVVNTLEYERMLAGSGPTGGELRRPDGAAPESVAIVHCAGSLDDAHCDYCSGICCLSAFKFNVLTAHKAPGARTTHYFRTLVMPGKDEAALYRKACATPGTRFVRYDDLNELSVRAAEGGGCTVRCGQEESHHDLVVLVPPIVPSGGVKRLAEVLDVGRDRNGFFGELHGLVNVTSSKVRGVYLAGSCQAPMDLGRAMTQGASAAASVMSALVPGRRLELEAVHAEVDESRCSGCASCVSVCPYRAITMKSSPHVSYVNPAMCTGCGTCVAACPSAAIEGRHFTNDQIFAEIEGNLA